MGEAPNPGQWDQRFLSHLLDVLHTVSKCSCSHGPELWRSDSQPRPQAAAREEQEPCVGRGVFGPREAAGDPGALMFI